MKLALPLITNVIVSIARAQFDHQLINQARVGKPSMTYVIRSVPVSVMEFNRENACWFRRGVS
jgi:hypothetical protein